MELAKQAMACSRLLELDPRNHGTYVILSNIYAKSGKWELVSELRKLMWDSGMKKDPGCSSIEADGIVHEFLVVDNSHPSSKLIQLVEEEDMKEQGLKLQSEKLAIAFDLITTEKSEPIRIVKNLRACRDSLISQTYIQII